MKKQDKRIYALVQPENVRKIEKLYYVAYAQIRRHSRVLYIPLDPLATRLNRLKKGDIIKYSLLELRRAPDVEEEG